jgi:hypothetical protein
MPAGWWRAHNLDASCAMDGNRRGPITITIRPGSSQQHFLGSNFLITTTLDRPLFASVTPRGPSPAVPSASHLALQPTKRQPPH